MKKKISLSNLTGLELRPDGLTEQQVVSQRARHGQNIIVERAGNPWFEILMDTIKDPMIWFLLLIGGVFIGVGNIEDALVLFVAIIPLILMDAFLHWRTQAATSTLKSQLVSESRVLRSGQEITVDTVDLVPGDLVVVSREFPFLPADGILESCHELQIDESILTGESFPVEKIGQPIDFADGTKEKETLIDLSHLGYAGTRVLIGNGLLRVLFTGANTSYGEIVQSVTSAKHERTELQVAIARLVEGLIFAAVLFCLFLAGIRVYQGHGWLDALLSAASLAIAAIPEEFPVVFTFFLGVGVYRLGKHHALVRRAVSVENIGRVSQICTDKTGTITMGRLQLTHLLPSGDHTESELLGAAQAASDPSGVDPVDQAILIAAAKVNVPALTRQKVFPFTEDRRRESAIVTHESNFACYTKGSPETLLALTTLSGAAQHEWRSKVARWAEGGHKVLAVASCQLPPSDTALITEPNSGFQLLGLLAFEDPPRAEVPKAIEYCRQNHIKVLMLTGDHPATGAAIARDIGLGGQTPNVISSEEAPEKFYPEWLQSHPEFIKDLDVIARCSPMQKLNIVTALKKHGQLVAVTGDGVNDVPALKAADIGIAMGQRGTRSAKEVASIILTDDNFNTIVSAIREGRQLFANLKNSFAYLLLFHMPFVLSAAIVPMMGYPLLYLPIHIVWLELIIHPTALFAFQDHASKQVDGSPKQETSLFSKLELLQLGLIGFGVTTAVTISYVFGVAENVGVEHARTKVLVMLSLWSSGLVASMTSLRSTQNKLLVITPILAALIMSNFPPLFQVMHIASVHLEDWLISFVVVALFLLTDLGTKRIIARSSWRT